MHEIRKQVQFKVGISVIRSGFRSGAELCEDRRGFSQSDREGMDVLYARRTISVCGIPWAADQSVSHGDESAALGDTMATDPSHVISTSSSDY